MPYQLVRSLQVLPAVVVATLSCSDPADEENTSVCRATSEFDIAGCAVLAGRVVDLTFRPKGETPVVAIVQIRLPIP